MFSRKASKWGWGNRRKSFAESHTKVSPKTLRLGDFLQLAVGANPDQPKGRFPMLAGSIARQVLHCKALWSERVVGAWVIKETQPLTEL
jgi:hypothetical protein